MGGKPVEKKPGTPGGAKPGDSVSAPATILVNVPAGAKLFVDGVATKSTSQSRLFVTPALPMGQGYNYTLRAEGMVNGEAVTQEQQITVFGGQQTPVTFNLNAQSVASK